MLSSCSFPSKQLSIKTQRGDMILIKEENVSCQIESEVTINPAECWLNEGEDPREEKKMY